MNFNYFNGNFVLFLSKSGAISPFFYLKMKAKEDFNERNKKVMF